MKLTTLKVTSPQKLNDLNNLIHDELFDLNKIQYDSEQGIVNIFYQRKFHNGPVRIIRNWFFYVVKEVDTIQSRLRINNVDEFSFQDSENIGKYSFNVAEYIQENSTLILHCDPLLKLDMKVSELTIESRDIKISGKSRISYWFGFIESDHNV